MLSGVHVILDQRVFALASVCQLNGVSEPGEDGHGAGSNATLEHNLLAAIHLSNGGLLQEARCSTPEIPNRILIRRTGCSCRREVVQRIQAWQSSIEINAVTASNATYLEVEAKN